MLRRASTGVSVIIGTLDELRRLPSGCARPSKRVHAAAGVCGLAEGFRRTEAVIVKMRYLRLEHGWDKYISLERSRRDLYNSLISPHFYLGP